MRSRIAMRSRRLTRIRPCGARTLLSFRREASVARKSPRFRIATRRAPDGLQMKITACALTDIGRKRDQNEDHFLLDDGGSLFAVCDGMGGYRGGEVASEMAITTLAEVMDKANVEREAFRPVHRSRIEAAAEKLRY